MRAGVLVAVALLALIVGGAVAAGGLSAGPVERTVLLSAQPATVAVDTHSRHVLVAYAGSNTLSVFDGTTLALLHTLALDQLTGAPSGALAVDERTGRAFAVDAGGDSVSVLGPDSGQIVDAVALGGGSSITPALAVDEGTGHVFVTADDGVTMLDGRTGAILRHIPIGVTPGGISAMAVDARSGHVLVVNMGDGSVTTLDTRSGTVLHTVYVGYGPASLAVDERAGRAFVVNTNDDSLSILDARSGTVLRTVPMDPGPIAVDETTERVFIATATNSGSSLVHVLDARSGRALSTMRIGLAGSYPVAMAVDAHTGRVVMATGNGVYVLDGHSGALLRAAVVGSAFAAIAVGPQASRAYVVGQVSSSDSMANLPCSGRDSVLDAWNAQVRRWLPWLPRQAPPTPVPAGTGLLSVLDVTRWPKARAGRRS
jgi:YVTN family beta-propeller protein